MTRPAADNVKVIWTGTGTGTMSLVSAVSGFQAFPAELDGQIVSYAIDHVGGVSPDVVERETGIGTYTASGTTLSRDFVTFSTAGAPTKVSFSEGTKHVRLVPLAQDLIENRSTSDPTINDDLSAGYIEGRSRWLNTATKKLFECRDHSVGAAVWRPSEVGEPSFGLGSDAVVQDAVFAGLNIVGDPTVTSWGEAFDLTTSLTASGAPTLNADGSVQTIANDATSTTFLSRTDTLLTTDRVLVLLT